MLYFFRRGPQLVTDVQQHQLELLNTLPQSFATNEYRLLIIDSIMNCFRVDYCGRGELADRQQKLNQFLSKLAHVAEGEIHNPESSCGFSNHC